MLFTFLSSDDNGYYSSNLFDKLNFIAYSESYITIRDKGFLTFSSVLVYLGVLNAIVFGMDKETLSRLNWSHMKVRHILSREKLCMGLSAMYSVLISFLLKCAMKTVI